jgi:uncharacterized protein YndB with AHSA1/START domain
VNVNNTTRTQGELEQDGERWRLRFTRTLPHAPEKVWRAITEAEHLDAWFPFRIEGEFATGARLQFVARDTPDTTFDGEMTEYRPPTVIEFRWSENEVVRLEVEPDGAGSRLTLLNTFDELGKAARDAAGWHGCLDDLELHLGHAIAPWSPKEHWQELFDGYVDRFPAAASTVGVPEEHPFNE